MDLEIINKFKTCCLMIVLLVIGSSSSALATSKAISTKQKKQSIIYGTVSRNGQPQQATFVGLYKKDGQFVNETKTNSGGTYQISAKPGDYYLLVVDSLDAFYKTNIFRIDLKNLKNNINYRTSFSQNIFYLLSKDVYQFILGLILGLLTKLKHIRYGYQNLKFRLTELRYINILLDRHIKHINEFNYCQLISQTQEQFEILLEETREILRKAKQSRNNLEVIMPKSSLKIKLNNIVEAISKQNKELQQLKPHKIDELFIENDILRANCGLRNKYKDIFLLRENPIIITFKRLAFRG